MNLSANSYDPETRTKFLSLKKSADTQRKIDLKNRLAKNPKATDLEYLLGAFIEMYEPHLRVYALNLAEKGFALDPISGFAGNNAQFQVVCSTFAVNFVIKNKLDRNGIKLRDYQGHNSFLFWPESPSLEVITGVWTKIVEILHDQGELTRPSAKLHAIEFRRKYLPEDSLKQKQRLFDKLKYKIREAQKEEIKKRKKINPHPDKVEIALGVFKEELEPQVRDA